MTTNGGEANRFSAAGPALGYLAQVDYALLLAVSEDVDAAAELSIETLDDVVFHGIEGTADDILQTKHHLNQAGSLANASVDLWKTLSNWIESGADGSLALLTTSVASPNTAAHCLRDGDNRDVQQALRMLETTARTSTNEDNKPRYDRFLNLGPAGRRDFLERMVVIDAAPMAESVPAALGHELQWAAPSRRRSGLIERLLGWWHQRAVAHLTAVASGATDRVAIAEIQSKIYGIAQTCATTTFQSTSRRWSGRSLRMLLEMTGSSCSSSG